MQIAIALLGSKLAERPAIAAGRFWLYGLLSVSGSVVLAGLLFGGILFSRQDLLDYTDAYMWFVLITAYLGWSLLLGRLVLRISPANTWRFCRALLISHGVLLLLLALVARGVAGFVEMAAMEGR